MEVLDSIFGHSMGVMIFSNNNSPHPLRVTTTLTCISLLSSEGVVLQIDISRILFIILVNYSILFPSIYVVAFVH